ncbi:MAG: hypothetical protein FWB89_09010 [Treponema sp.]|nr:hypothetical protein [Treponema sp.]
MKRLFVIFALAMAPAIFAQDEFRAAEVIFHDFTWGTSMKDFTSRMGTPVHSDKINGLTSLVYDNLIVSGYPTFMVVYFSNNGLEGGTYYFHTNTLDELMQCYKDVQKELLERYGPTQLRDGIIREMRPYETSWNLDTGYVYLKVNTRLNEPVSLWYSSPYLTRMLFGS